MCEASGGFTYAFSLQGLSDKICEMADLELKVNELLPERKNRTFSIAAQKTSEMYGLVHDVGTCVLMVRRRRRILACAAAKAAHFPEKSKAIDMFFKP